MTYQVPRHIDNDKIFIVNRSAIDNRIDAQYYNANLDLSGFVKLSSIAIVKGGKRIPKGYGYSNDPTSYYYLRVADMVTDTDIDINSLMHISKEVFDILERYEIKEGELAISIAGTIGKMCILKSIPDDKRVILTENCAKILIKPSIELLPEYLKICMELPVVKKQLELNYIQTTIPKLGLDKIMEIKIPPIPCVQKQKEIVSYINNAYTQRQKKEDESKQLVDSINIYLLQQLGVRLPDIQIRTLQDRIFTVSINEVRDGRMDPKSVLYLGEYAKSETFDNVQLKQIAGIEKGDSITSAEVNKEGKYPVVAGGQTSPYNHDKYNYKGDVVTVSASGAYSGYVWYHKDPIFASDCSVIYSKNSQFLTQYIFEVLKAQQSQIYLLQQGAGQPHVYPDDLGKLWIPVVSMEKQQEIVAHISEMRQQAKALQEEGKAILERAKREVGSMIIG